MIRQVAEQTVEMRNPHADESSKRQDLLRVVKEICDGIMVFHNCGETPIFDLKIGFNKPVQFDKACLGFRQAVLSVAAYTNDLELAHKLLASTSRNRRKFMFFFEPYAAAAYKGNMEFISCL